MCDRLKLLFWALGHDLKPVHVWRRAAMTLRYHSAVLSGCAVNGSAALFILLCIPLMPLVVALKASYYALAYPEEIKALRDSMRRRGK